MFHKAKHVDFKEGTVLEVTFQNGYVVSYDMSALFYKYPQLEALLDRDLFTSGKLMGTSGIMWNDDLDIEAETIYQEGKVVRRIALEPELMAGCAVAEARANAGMSQSDLSAATGIDQSDISKIERGVANPSVSTLSRIAEALGGELNIQIIK